MPPPIHKNDLYACEFLLIITKSHLREQQVLYVMVDFTTLSVCPNVWFGLYVFLYLGEPLEYL